MEIVIAILAICVGVVIGVALSNYYEKQLEITCDTLQRNLDSAPIVIECQLGQPLTVEQMDKVVAANLIKVYRHFYKCIDDSLSFVSKCDKFIFKNAEAMLQWYNPDAGYTRLVIVGWLRGGVVRMAWTWQTRNPELIVTKDAVKWENKYYEDELGNPMILGEKK